VQNGRELGGGLIADGVAFRIFLWLVPFALVAAAILSFWSEQDPDASNRPPRPLRALLGEVVVIADAQRRRARMTAPGTSTASQ
jgi:hypothetical protein